MILQQEHPSKPRRQAVVFILLCALSLVVVIVYGFRHAGRWLVVNDDLRPSDVIVVLSGAMPYRAEEAASLFQKSYAPEVWVSRPDSSAAALDALGIRYVGEEEYNRQVLLRAGVPDSTIHVFPATIVNTEEEIEIIVRQMQLQKKSSVIIVTSPPHTRRVRAIWRKLAPENLRMMVHPAPKDPYDAAYWWRNTRDSLSVSREWLGLLNAWAGLPVRPRTAPQR